MVKGRHHGRSVPAACRSLPLPGHGGRGLFVYVRPRLSRTPPRLGRAGCARVLAESAAIPASRLHCHSTSWPYCRALHVIPLTGLDLFASDIETCKHVSASLGSVVIPALGRESPCAFPCAFSRASRGCAHFLTAYTSRIASAPAFPRASRNCYTSLIAYTSPIAFLSPFRVCRIAPPPCACDFLPPSTDW